MADKLLRSRDNRILFGVCGGIGEHLDVDPTIIRLLWIVFSLAWGFGILVYILALFIMPLRPASAPKKTTKKKTTRKK